MMMDLSKLTDAELRDELSRRKQVRTQKPASDPQPFFKVVSRGYFNADYDIEIVTLQEEKNRWKVIDGAKHVNHRKYLNKSEKWRIHASLKDALVEIIDDYARAAANKRHSKLWDARRENELLIKCLEWQQKLKTEFDVEHNPIEHVMSEMLRRFNEQVEKL